MPTKIYCIKINDFWINLLGTVLLITHVKKQRNRKCQKLDECLQITTSPISKITETAPFPPCRLSDISIAIHSNSIAGYVIMFTIGLLYSKPIVNGSRYWIWMNSYWNVRKSVRWKGSSFCDFWNWTCCDLKAFISFLALSISLFFDVGNEEDCS